MNNILIATGDEKITLLMHDAKKAKRRRYCAFGSIAYGVAALPILGLSAMYHTSGNNSLEPFAIFTGGMTIAGGAVMNLFLSRVYQRRYNECKEQAINIYNQKY